MLTVLGLIGATVVAFAAGMVYSEQNAAKRTVQHPAHQPVVARPVDEAGEEETVVAEEEQTGEE